MTEQDPDRLRDAIARHQTTCRCGVMLASCADCRGWLIENSPRIERAWKFFTRQFCFHGDWPITFREADAAEANDLGVYLARRFLNG